MTPRAAARPRRRLPGVARLFAAAALVAAAPSALQHLERIVGPPGPPRVVVALHGLGGAPDRFVRWLSASPEPLRVLLPRGPLPSDAGHGWFPGGVRLRARASQAPEVRASAERVLAWLDAVEVDRATLVGFSQGGMIALALALEHPERVERAVVFGTWLPEAMLPAEPPPEGAPTLSILHGEADPSFPVHEMRARAQAMSAAGWTVQLQTFPGAGHEVTPAMQRAALPLITRP